MIYDADTWIGHWPFRSLPRRSAGDLLKQMDKHGIDKALVGSLHGLFYKDAHEANRELFAEIRRRRDRLIGCAVLDPTYHGWRDDLKQCRQEFGMPVLRLVPDYHAYKLTDPAAAEIVEAACDLKMIVALSGRIVDDRGRHRLDPGRETSADDAASLLAKFPGASFLMLNFGGLVQVKGRAAAKCLYDIVRMQGRAGHGLGKLIEKHGTDRLALGTTMLLRYGKPVFVGLDFCKPTKPQREAILWRNLAAFVPDMA